MARMGPAIVAVATMEGMDNLSLLFLIGLVIGAIGTFVGAGGGFLLVPILLLGYGLPSDLAAGTSLAVVLLNAASGALSYARQGRIDYRSGAIFALLTIPGAILGAKAAPHVAGRPFHVGFAVLLLFVAVPMLLGRRRGTPSEARSETAAGRARTGGFGRVTRSLTDRAGRTHTWSFSMPLGMALSLVVGFLSSILGIGGGIVHVPALVTLLFFPAHVATATSHFILVFTALAGVAAHAAQGTVDFRLAVPIGLGALAGAPVGAWLSRHADPRWILRGLGVALCLVAARLMVT